MTIQSATETLTHALLQRSQSPAREYFLHLVDDLPKGKSGTAKAWMQQHDGRTVDTLQVRQSGNNGGNGLWAPGPRVIDASRSASVQFDGSTRYYDGLRVIASDDTHLVVESDEEVIVYRLVFTASL